MQIKYALLIATVVILFSLIVVGAYVAADPSAGEACGSSESWPLCNGQLFPSSNPNVIVEYTHRLLAIISALFLFTTTALFWRRGTTGPTRNGLTLASILMVFQIGLGDVVIGADLQPALVALHQASALAIFGLTVASAAIKQEIP